MKRPALQNKRVGVLRMAFRAQKVVGTFEQRAPERDSNPYLRDDSSALVLHVRYALMYFSFSFLPTHKNVNISNFKLQG